MLKDYDLDRVEIRDHQFIPQVEKCITSEVFKLLKPRFKGKSEKGLIPIGVAFVLAITPKSSQTDQNTGYVHGEGPGEKHCFHFAAPTGWSLDNRSGRQHGLPTVFYPANSSFQNSTSFMYAKAAVKSMVGNTVQELIDTNINFFKTQYNETDSSAKFIEEITAKSGEKAKIYQYSKSSQGITEFGAYFNGTDTFNYFILATPNPEDKELYGKFKELAISYRGADDCVPCCDKN